MPLVLSRLKGETIIIGDDIEITVVGIKGNTARLSITAPPDVPVHRKEVYDAIIRDPNRGDRALRRPTPRRSHTNESDGANRQRPQ